ncbi:malonate decarboxylase holo-ACP synthase [Desertibacillus haloalkaliphilus]|uniref:malonate decarboxylase holo-ACP synthase n=1 Tax=Desertibacillus haloalkaliphilus TaxID=1328930 RepID=UPI001C275F8A|nr:malonate decarboxylase holo-ACP synthase [Desertibacillus haloalkaliphilus]MBU8908282.1 malonate decarboxylase holo-ACP synthase [Desertibacillus haloalkaliphilus]
MELNPHDLLEIRGQNDLVSYNPLQEWINQSLSEAPFVVVRRASAPQGFVAVGIRGSLRNQRFAAFLPTDCIVRRITPEQIAYKKRWRKVNKDIFHNIESVSRLMNRYALQWGPTGSCGFELASKKETVTATSDIDIIIRPIEQFTIELAQKLESDFNKLPFRIDTQVEISEGAFSLSEYANSKRKPILIRTINGPILKRPSQNYVKDSKNV